MLYHTILDLPPFDEKSGELNVIIETPKGSRNKYVFDTDLGVFRLKKMLPTGAIFPFDFGFVPQTLAEDGDPLDVLLLMEEPAFPGCLIQARLVGIIEARQTKKGKTTRNDRLIAVACGAEMFCKVDSMDTLNDELLRQIEHFFISYNRFEGKKFSPIRRSGPAQARRKVEAARKKYSQAKGIAAPR